MEPNSRQFGRYRKAAIPVVERPNRVDRSIDSAAGIVGCRGGHARCFRVEAMIFGDYSGIGPASGKRGLFGKVYDARQLVGKSRGKENHGNLDGLHPVGDFRQYLARGGCSMTNGPGESRPVDSSNIPAYQTALRRHASHGLAGRSHEHRLRGRNDHRQRVETACPALADDTFEGRATGSRGGRAAAGYLQSNSSVTASRRPANGGTYFQTFDGNSRNILAMIEGSDPELKKEVVIASAPLRSRRLRQRPQQLWPDRLHP